MSIPKADVQPLTSQDSPFFITVTADGTIYMEETPVTAEDLLCVEMAGAATGSVVRTAKLGLLDLAAVVNELAARLERAPGRVVQQIGQTTLKTDQRLPGTLDALHETEGVRVRWLL